MSTEEKKTFCKINRKEYLSLDKKVKDELALTYFALKKLEEFDKENPQSLEEKLKSPEQKLYNALTLYFEALRFNPRDISNIFYMERLLEEHEKIFSEDTFYSVDGLEGGINVRTLEDLQKLYSLFMDVIRYNILGIVMHYENINRETRKYVAALEPASEFGRKTIHLNLGVYSMNTPDYVAAYNAFVRIVRESFEEILGL